MLLLLIVVDPSARKTCLCLRQRLRLCWLEDLFIDKRPAITLAIVVCQQILGAINSNVPLVQNKDSLVQG